MITADLSIVLHHLKCKNTLKGPRLRFQPMLTLNVQQCVTEEMGRQWVRPPQLHSPSVMSRHADILLSHHKGQWPSWSCYSYRATQNYCGRWIGGLSQEKCVLLGRHLPEEQFILEIRKTLVLPYYCRPDDNISRPFLPLLEENSAITTRHRRG